MDIVDIVVGIFSWIIGILGNQSFMGAVSLLNTFLLLVLVKSLRKSGIVGAQDFMAAGQGLMGLVGLIIKILNDRGILGEAVKEVIIELVKYNKISKEDLVRALAEELLRSGMLDDTYGG